MAKKSRKAGIYPPPVYVAQFATGETGRMSFHSPVGKPLDYDYGRRVVAAAWSHPMPGEKGWRGGMWRQDEFSTRTDIISGHVEHDGVIYLDPYFMEGTTAAPKPTTKPRDSLASIIAKIGKMNQHEIERLLDAIAQREELLQTVA